MVVSVWFSKILLMSVAKTCTDASVRSLTFMLTVFGDLFNV